MSSATHFQVAFYESTGFLAINVPDKLKFPGISAWFWLSNAHTIVMSPDRPVSNPIAVECTLTRSGKNQWRHTSLPGLRMPAGTKFFGLSETTYQTDGDHVYTIAIPPVERRKPQRKYTGRTRRGDVEILPPKPKTVVIVTPEPDQPRRIAPAPRIVPTPTIDPADIRVQVLVCMPGVDDIVCSVPLAEAFALASKYRV